MQVIKKRFILDSDLNQAQKEDLKNLSEIQKEIIKVRSKNK